MTMCPHCGRNLRPAGPRWLFWLVGLIVLALGAFWLLGRLPIERFVQEASSARTRVISLMQLVELPTATPGTIALIASTPRPPTTTPTRTATASPTRTLTTAPRTAVPSPTATSDQGRTYTIQNGDSFEIIGAKLGIPWQLIAAANNMNAGSLLLVGEKLRVPAPTPTVLPTASYTPTIPSASATATRTPVPTVTASPTATPRRATPTATQTAATQQTPGRTTYRIQSGDSFAGIGERFGVPWEAIAAANNMTADSMLMPGDEIVIPAPGAPLPPTATPRPRPTATPVTPTATAAPAFPAPILTSPSDGTPYSGDNANIVLIWQPVPGIPSGAKYRITLRYLAGGVQQLRYWDTPLTSIGVAPDVWGHADQPARQHTWFVTVIQVTTDGKGGELVIPLSQPSQPRTFTWN
jgi:LysM repeat protein